MKIPTILYALVAFIVGATLFVYAEIDDSPGGQLIGVVVALTGIVAVIKGRKKDTQ